MKSLLLALFAASLVVGCTRTPFKDFDVAASTFDPNPFPLNPQWGKIMEHHTVPNPAESCPITSDSDNPDDWTRNPKFPNCTSYDVTFNGGIWCGPHVNFMPVTYEGIVTWEDHSSSWLDDDYSLNVTRDDSALYSTAGQRVHIEFNSDETVDNWDDTNTWWDDFHHHYVDQDNGHVIDGRAVTVIGLLNLDALHSGSTELHPVYAMFVRQSQNDPTRATWAFFVRNWGDQGMCGSDQQNMYTGRQQVKVHLSNAVSVSTQNVWYGAQNDDNLGQMNATIQSSGDGVLFTFTLLPPEKQSWFVGDVTFTTRQFVNEAVARATPKNAAIEADDKDPDPDLTARIARLPQSARQELNARLEGLFPRKKPMRVQALALPDTVKPEKIARSVPLRIDRNRALVRPQPDTASKDRRDKKIEAAKKFLADQESGKRSQK